MSVAIALTVAGLRLGEIEAVPLVFGVSVLVGLVFFVGALVKAYTHERAFRDLIQFNKDFGELPLAQTMPAFHQSSVGNVNQSIEAFYRSLSIGIPIAGVPLYGVIALGLNQLDSRVPAWLTFGMLVGLASTAGIGYWVKSPRSALQIRTTPSEG